MLFENNDNKMERNESMERLNKIIKVRIMMEATFNIQLNLSIDIISELKLKDRFKIP